MAILQMTTHGNDDPRKLRALLSKISGLARSHSVGSVVVGLAAQEGDLQFPEFVDYLQSALRVEDAIFRLTRERAVVHLADVDGKGAREILERIRRDFVDEYPAMSEPVFETRLFDVSPASSDDLSVKAVLKAVFEG